MTHRCSSVPTRHNSLHFPAMAIAVWLFAACATTRETTPPPVVTGAIVAGTAAGIDGTVAGVSLLRHG